MEDRIRRESSWNRKEKKDGHSLISRLINTVKRVDLRGNLPEMQSTTSIEQQAHVTWVSNADRGRAVSTAPISTLGRMLL